MHVAILSARKIATESHLDATMLGGIPRSVYDSHLQRAGAAFTTNVVQVVVRGTSFSKAMISRTLPTLILYLLTHFTSSRNTRSVGFFIGWG